MENWDNTISYRHTLKHYKQVFNIVICYNKLYYHIFISQYRTHQNCKYHHPLLPVLSQVTVNIYLHQFLVCLHKYHCFIRRTILQFIPLSIVDSLQKLAIKEIKLQWKSVSPTLPFVASMFIEPPIRPRRLQHVVSDCSQAPGMWPDASQI